MSRSFLTSLLFCLLLLAVAVPLSLRLGAAEMPLAALLEDSNGIFASRLFRTLCGGAVGAALAVSGLMLQALTRNPLADPGITGINAGAALSAIALAYFFPGFGGGAVLMAASLGAGFAGFALWRLAGGVSATGADGIALRLPLAGLAIEALCLSLASALILTDAEMQARYLRWLSGSIPAVARGEAPALFAIAALLTTGFFLCERLELLRLGAAVSDSLGRSPTRTIALTLIHVTILSGASVAIAGPLAFLGLLVPFVARGLTGGVLRLAYLIAVPLGAAVLIFADTAGRIIARPGEVDAGILAALMGGPALILVLRRVLGHTRGRGAVL
ncbi:FecCD family ABC transporter permease [Celeribacter sp. SCSIO 80788]|uniref:FecCD family ABC transporter permease n=1 Tax=Celeribacter sp. SCSIO 80788 TaxID=3117013 RepID=UPI003DA5D812